MFEIRLEAGVHKESKLLRIPTLRRRYFTFFVTEEGKMFLPTARHIWETLQTAGVKVLDSLVGAEAQVAFDKMLASAEPAGQEAFNSLQQAHLNALNREEERGSRSFTARRKAIESVGLPEVRQSGGDGAQSLLQEFMQTNFFKIGLRNVHKLI